MEKNFEASTFPKRLKTMLAVDFRRMFTIRFFYIMLGIALAMPVLILVMTTMMDGSVSVDPNTGKETVMQGFENVWQIIGSLSTSQSTGGMDLVSMCNINLIFFISAIFVCIFISDDFKSGYAKNLFAVRAKKADYIISKTIVGFTAGGLMLTAFFTGSMIGGAVAGLPFKTAGFNVGNVILCMLSKIFLMGVFISIYTLVSIIAKQRSWLSILLSLGAGMLLFMMIPSLTPLDATFLNFILCLAGGCVFSIGLGAISCLILRKTDIL